MNDLGNRIKELRIAAGLTQEKLANDLGMLKEVYRDTKVDAGWIHTY